MQRLAERTRGRGAWLLAIGVPALLVGADLVAGRGIARFHDNEAVQGPLRLEAARQWREGRVPLWNPYKRGGAPLLADVSGALYPPNLVFAWANEQTRHRALDVVAALHHVGAGAAMYFLLVALGLRSAAAVAGSIVYSVNGYFVYGAGRWIDLQNAMVWAPLVLASLQYAGRSSQFWLAAGLGAAAFALQSFAGYPEYSFYTALLAGGFTLSLVVAERQRWARHVGALLVVGLGGVLLAAPQLLPTLAAVSEGVRPAVVPYQGFVALALRPGDLLGLLVPLGAGDVWPRVSLSLAHGALFVGIGVLGFAGAALCRPGRVAWFGLATTLVAGILALGPNSPVGAVGYYIPGLNAFRSPMKHVFELSLGISVLVACGIDRFLAAERGTRAAVVAAGIATAGLSVFASAGPVGLALGGVAAALAACVAASALLPDRRIAVAFALAAAVASLAYNRHTALERARDEPPLPSASAALREALAAEPYARVLLLRDSLKRTALVEDVATAARIPSVYGAGPYLWPPFARALGMDEIGFIRDPQVLRHGDPTLDLLSVRYVLSPTRPGGRALREPLLRASAEASNQKTERLGDFLLVRRPSAHPIARLARRVQCEPGRSAAPEPAEPGVVWIQCSEGAGADAELSGGDVQVEEFAPGEIRLRARVAGPERGFLVTSLLDYPGWAASLDEAPARIVRSFGLVQGVWLPPGEHRVHLRYRPVSFRVGVIASAAAALSLLALVMVERRRRQAGSGH